MMDTQECAHIKGEYKTSLLIHRQADAQTEVHMIYKCPKTLAVKNDNSLG